MIKSILGPFAGIVSGSLFGLVFAIFVFDVESEKIVSGFMIAGAIVGGLHELAKLLPNDENRRR